MNLLIGSQFIGLKLSRIQDKKKISWLLKQESWIVYGAMLFGVKYDWCIWQITMTSIHFYSFKVSSWSIDPCAVFFFQSWCKGAETSLDWGPAAPKLLSKKNYCLISSTWLLFTAWILHKKGHVEWREAFRNTNRECVSLAEKYYSVLRAKERGKNAEKLQGFSTVDTPYHCPSRFFFPKHTENFERLIENACAMNCV